MCEKEAKKYNKRYEYQKNSGSSYNSAFKNGWLDEICNHMIKRKVISKNFQVVLHPI